jgi:hypothetical protein
VASAAQKQVVSKLSDQFWRLNNLYKIRDKQGKSVTFVMNGAQETLYWGMILRNTILKARQLGFCLDPSTRVLTANLHWVKIKDIHVGHEIVAVDEHIPGGRGKARKMRTAVVEGMAVVEKEAFQVDFDDGRHVICTGKHRWLSRKTNPQAAWRCIEQGSKKRLTVGTKVRWITHPWDESQDYEDGWFGGMLDGEGCMALPKSSGCEVNVSQVIGPVWDRLIDYCVSRGYNARIEADKQPERDSKHGKRAVPKLVISRINELFRLIGTTRPTRFLSRRFWEGKDLPGKRTSLGWSTIVGIRSVGKRKMIDLQTSTGTFIAEGFVSHNSTLIDLYILDTCLWNRDVKAGIIAHHQDDAKAIFDEKIRYPFQNLSAEFKALAPSGDRDRAGEYQFSNGSSIRVSTSFRSGTLQILHVSEYGKIAAKYPEKAREIKTGAFEAVASGQMILVESTAEGREGEFYDMCQKALKLDDAHKKHTDLDFKMHFFAWWQHAEYRYAPESVLITEEMRAYFETLEGRGIRTDAEQRAWYVLKASSLGDDMHREYPSFPEEAFLASIEGAYYAGEMTNLRRAGRIGRVPYDKLYPVYTFWDLGIGDNDMMAIWCFQDVGVQGRLIDYYENAHEGVEHYADWLRGTGYSFMRHYFPHDAAKREIGAGARSIKQSFELQGVRPIIQVPRPINNDEKKAQIQATRNFIAKCWIDEQKCDKGLKCLENYRHEWDEKLGAFKDRALHNWASHGADALRTGAVGHKIIEYVSDDMLVPEYFEDM